MCACSSTVVTFLGPVCTMYFVLCTVNTVMAWGNARTRAWLGFHACRLILRAALAAAAAAAATAAATADAAAPQIWGAIRWDAFYNTSTAPDDPGFVTSKVLQPAQWHDRLPWFSYFLPDGNVTFDNNNPATMDTEIEMAVAAGLTYFAFDVYPDDIAMIADKLGREWGPRCMASESGHLCATLCACRVSACSRRPPARVPL